MYFLNLFMDFLISLLSILCIANNSTICIMQIVEISISGNKYKTTGGMEFFGVVK